MTLPLAIGLGAAIGLGLVGLLAVATREGWLAAVADVIGEVAELLGDVDGD
jgi:hypothetical protein